MKRLTSTWSLVAIVACAIGLLPIDSNAQNVSGQARAVQATVATPLGGITTSILADTGTLSGPTDAREASQLSGSIGSLFSAETLHATTIGWPDQAASEASMAGLALTIAGNTISAGFVQARALAGADGFRTTTIDGLTINGQAVDVTGAPNQTIGLPGGGIIINEQAAGVVNALHIFINGVADVVIASARANAQ